MTAPICLPTSDTALLARLHGECFAEGWTAEGFRSLLDNPGAFALIDDSASGFIVIQVAADQSEVLTLGVRPAARRRGLAKQLVDTAVNCALERGANCIFLEVDCANNQAIALYNGCGFAVAGRRPGYYQYGNGTVSDALTLRMDIRALRVGNGVQLG